MPRKAKELKPLEVSRLVEPGLHAVGGVAGLSLQVSTTGARSWILRVVIADKRREVGLGGYPDVSLAQARAAAQEKRSAVVNGVDPIAQRKELRSSLKAARAREITFKQAALDYIDANEAGWKNAKHAQQWRNTLETYAYPKIGNMLVPHVHMSHVLEVLKPIWSDRTETASRLRGRIELVIAAGDKVAGIERPNPARWKHNLDTQLAKPSKIAKKKHYDALPIDGVGEFMQRLRGQEGVGARALEFAILTAARSGEVRGLEWKEIDLDGRLWTVPGDRMKAGKEHRVPLSDAAVKLLKTIKKTATADLVFPAHRGGPLSDMTLSAVLRRMKVPAVPHGFRSSFRDWAAERTNYPHEAAEMALAHTVGDKVEAAYRRGDLLAKRSQMMNDWATFCATPAKKAAVIPIGKKTRAAR